MGMVKLLQYDPVDRFGIPLFRVVDFKGFNKFAATVREYISPEVLAFIKEGEFPTDDDHIVTLTNVLGASEVYGSNNNGDAFFKAALAHKGRDYGHKTFEHGHCFTHHNNSDPANAVGKICYAHWNDRMARVETISCIHRGKAGKFAEQIDRGEMPSVSMGCKVSFDSCSICGNKAPNMKAYCDHLKYAMNRIMPGGRKVYADNPYPKFFDQSFVLLGADRTASHLAKIALESSSPSPCQKAEPGTGSSMPSAWLGLQAYDQKTGERKKAGPKAAEIDKQVPLEIGADEKEVLDSFVERVVPRLEQTEPTLPKAAIDALADSPPEKVAASLLCMGVVLRPSEWTSYCFQRAGRTKEAELALELDDAQLLDLCPATAEQVGEIEFSLDADQVDVKVAAIVQPWLADRSAFEPYFSERVDRTPGKPAIRKRAVDVEMFQEAVPGFVASLLAYLGYRMAVPETRLRMIEEAIARRPGLLIPLFGAFAMGQRMLLGKRQPEMRPGMPAYSMRTASEKTAQIPWYSMVLPFGATYLGSAYLRGKARQGYPLSAPARMVAQHPFIAGLGAVTGAQWLKHLGKLGLKGLGAAKGVGGLLKGGAAQIAMIEAPRHYLEARYPGTVSAADGAAERSTSCP